MILTFYLTDVFLPQTFSLMISYRREKVRGKEELRGSGDTILISPGLRT